MRYLLASPLIPMQIVAATILLLVFVVWPPRSGGLLLIPLTEQAGDDVARAAIAGGALLLGRGPLPGSLIMVGDRARIARQTRGWNILVTAAPKAGCLPPIEDLAA